ncbi:MAG: hypothetical protein DRR04_12980 [Gammaproteobacteria bacterium]|nr:MAG: hypothetical protein DRQ97_08550 [Gammaproteobacteria bacterium]RLA57343.1 MAG: hypothetical protein DRR04_12980 [Gammaproteobacteria bacterium]
MKNERTLRTLHHRAHTLQNETARKFNFTAGALKNIGNILFSHEGGSIEGLTPGDIQGLCLAVESLGEYLEHLSADLELEGGFILEKIEELEAQKSTANE